MQAQLNPRIINILLKQQSELHKNNLDGKLSLLYKYYIGIKNIWNKINLHLK